MSPSRNICTEILANLVQTGVDARIHSLAAGALSSKPRICPVKREAVHGDTLTLHPAAIAYPMQTDSEEKGKIFRGDSRRGWPLVEEEHFLRFETRFLHEFAAGSCFCVFVPLITDESGRETDALSAYGGAEFLNQYNFSSICEGENHGGG